MAILVIFHFFFITLFYFFNKLGELNPKIIKFSFIILITFLITKNFNRIYKEVTIKDFLKNEYPIKNFRTSNFTTSEIIKGFIIENSLNGG